MLDKESLKPVIESLIFAADSAISFEKILGVLEGEEKAAVREALNELMEDYRAKAGGFLIEEVASGYQFRTNPEFAPWLRWFFKIGMQKISKAAMETLAVVAYKQPVTRGEIEGIRGVDSGGVLATLMEKRFIKIVGRKEVPGRPVVYGTTKEFLETFDLRDLSCLPSLKDLKKMEEEYAQEEGQGAAEDAVEDAVQGAEKAERGDQEQADVNQDEAGDQGQDEIRESIQDGDTGEAGDQGQDEIRESIQDGDTGKAGDQGQDEIRESIQDGDTGEDGEAIQASAEDCHESGWDEDEAEEDSGTGRVPPGEASEDNSDGGDNLPEEGGGAHNPGPGDGKREGNN